MAPNRVDRVDDWVPKGVGIEHVILSDVVRGYCVAVTSDDEESRRLVATVERWMCDATSLGAFAFARMCRATGVDARRLRRRLLKLRNDSDQAAFWSKRATA